MSNIKFEPWIGSKYNSDNNRFRIGVLVLGESHYAPGSETRPTITKEIVQRLAQNERYAFFTKISKVLLGLDGKTWIDNKSRGEIWEHVAFYNYIQSFVGTSSRIRPSFEMWVAAKSPFLEVLNIHKPKVILVLGKELAANLPPIFEDIEVCKIQHPSSRFSYDKWNQLFIDAVERAVRCNASSAKKTNPPFSTI